MLFKILCSYADWLAKGGSSKGVETMRNFLGLPKFYDSQEKFALAAMKKIDAHMSTAKFLLSSSGPKAMYAHVAQLGQVRSFVVPNEFNDAL